MILPIFLFSIFFTLANNWTGTKFCFLHQSHSSVPFFYFSKVYFWWICHFGSYQDGWLSPAAENRRVSSHSCHPCRNHPWHVYVPAEIELRVTKNIVEVLEVNELLDAYTYWRDGVACRNLWKKGMSWTYLRHWTGYLRLLEAIKRDLTMACQWIMGNTCF